MNKLRAQKILATGIIVSSLFVSYGVFAQTDTASSSAQPASGSAASIAFPIPELGNCANKDACRAYCADANNMEACIAFSQAHGLINKDEANRAKQFKDGLQAGGPGGCTSPDACKTYCSDTAHLEACVAFAKKHGIKNEGLEHSEKVSAYLKSGGQLPGSCTSKDACEAYCHDFKNADECMAFAKKVGAPTGNGPSPKLLELMKSGQTPGGCQSKDACEAYCKDVAHRDECIAFAEKAGLMKPDEATKLKELGGKGPGGCDSDLSCRAYCNDAAHRDECYKFAEEHNLITKEKLEQTKDGLVRMRQGLDNMPPEVAGCVKSSLGDSAVNDIESGKLVPGPDFGQKIKDCFEKFGKNTRPQKEFSNLPADAKACVKEKLGSDFDNVANGTAEPTPEMADAVRVCFGQVRLMQGAPQAGMNGAGEGQGGNPGMGFAQFIKNAPPEVQSCIKSVLGDQYDAAVAGSLSTTDMRDKLKSCFEQFQPKQAVISQGVGVPDVMKRCMVQIFGAEADAQANTGAFKNDPALRAKLEDCMKAAGGMMNKPFDPAQGKPPAAGGGSGGAVMPDMMRKCWAQIFGTDPGNTPDTSALKNNPDAEAKLRACMGTGNAGGGIMTKPFDPTQGKPPMPPTGGGTANSDVLKKCWAQIYPDASGAVPDTSVLKERPELQEKLRACMGAQQGTVPPKPTGEKGICPMMPTVESCPEGQVKKVIYSSPECGVYYACVSASGGAGSGTYPSVDKPPVPMPYNTQDGKPPAVYPGMPLQDGAGQYPPTQTIPPPLPPPVEPPPQSNAAPQSFLGSVLQSFGSFLGIR